MTVYICPACGRENREGKYCSVCGCYLPRLFAEERQPERIDLSNLPTQVWVRGRPTNLDAMIYEEILKESYTARLAAMYRVAMDDWDDHIRAGEPWR